MRLIDADVLFKAYENIGWYNNADRDEIAEKILLEQPIVDAVPVVRCKDCKWYERKYPWNDHIYECSYLEAPMDDNDYCSLGERREDGTD